MARRALVARTAAWLPALLVAGAAPAVELPGVTPGPLQQVASCVAASAPGQTMKQRLTLDTDRKGARQRVALEARWRRDADGLFTVRVAIESPQPPTPSTAPFLIIERRGRAAELVRAEPGRDAPVRSTLDASSGRLFGSDFTLEEFVRMQNPARFPNARLGAESEVDGRVAWTIETPPGRGPGADPHRIVAAIDKVRCVPLQLQFFRGDHGPAGPPGDLPGDGDDLHKLLLFPPGKVLRQGGGWLPMVSTMKDLLRDSRSVLTVKDVQLDVDVGDLTASGLR